MHILNPNKNCSFIMKYIITHDGRFHLDEILACVLLKKLYKDAQIIRTRDLSAIQAVIEKNEHLAVVDVFGHFDPINRLFDHHQQSFHETFFENNYFLSTNNSINNPIDKRNNPIDKRNKYLNSPINQINSAINQMYNPSNNSLNKINNPIDKRNNHMDKRNNHTVERNSPLNNPINQINNPINKINNLIDERNNYSYNSTKLSSSGLIFKYYGIQLLDLYFPEIEKDLKMYLYQKIYTEYFEYVDAIDNGIDICSKYKIRSLSSIIHSFEDNFEKAFEFINDDFDRYFLFVTNQLPKVTRIRELLSNFGNGDVLFVDDLKDCACLVREFENEYCCDVKYVIVKNDESSFSCYAVPKQLLGFESKLPFPKKWRGLRNEDLKQATGCDNVVFCHATGFLLIVSDYATALRLCEESLKQMNKNS